MTKTIKPTTKVPTKTQRPTVAELEAHLEQEAAWAEAKYGPQAARRLTRPGRPPKGARVEPTTPHSLRVQDSIWSAVATKAKAAGITVNQAAQIALLEWSKR
ncbi:MAG TPA: hypothetical protein VFT46_12765 [Holophagaceae bacterium]|nr:hypothetical protein [Holophagaceae bacterium]